MSLKLAALPGGKSTTLSLRRTIKQDISRRVRAAVSKKYIVKGTTDSNDEVSNMMRQRAREILPSKMIVREIIAGCIECISRFSESKPQFRLSIWPVAAREPYGGNYINIEYRDLPDPDSRLKKISLPLKNEKQALYFVCGKSRVSGGRNPLPCFHIWVYAVFAPYESDGKNIEGILKNKHILHKPGVTAVKTENSG